MYRVDNAVILAAGTSSRFAPLSYEMPKALINVKGEVLIERQIRQLLEAGINEIYVVTGYKKEQFSYLQQQYGVNLIFNPDYRIRNNNASIWQARDVIRNTYICSADDYFTVNPFEIEAERAYYASVFVEGPTDEWCLTQKNGIIDSVTVGGSDSWTMLGHVFWDECFSKRFLSILKKVYDLPETAGKLWESIYAEHLRELPMSIREYPQDVIHEFDTLDELRQFDCSYIDDTRSGILKKISLQLGIRENDIINIHAYRGADAAAAGFSFECGGKNYCYDYSSAKLSKAVGASAKRS